MKRRTAKAVATLSVSAALVLGLSACGSHESERKAATEELEGRGFEEVKYVENLPTSKRSDVRMLFTVKLDECRLDVGITGESKLGFRSSSLSDAQWEALRTKAGVAPSDIVNASFVRMYAQDLGLQHCMKATSAK